MAPGKAVVFRLRQYVRRDEFFLLPPVGDDQNFARTREHVDPHVAVHFLFRKRDEDIARTRDNVRLGNAFRAVGERGDRLRAARFEQRGDAAFLCRHQHGGIDLAAFGWRDRVNFLYARRLCGKDAHQHRTGQGRRAAGHVDPRPPHGTDNIARRSAVFGADIRLQGIARVIIVHVFHRFFQGNEKIFAHLFISVLIFFFAHAHGIGGKNAAVEFFRIGKERLVPALLHVAHNFAHRRDFRRVVEFSAHEDLFRLVRVRVYLHKLPVKRIFSFRR